VRFAVRWPQRLATVRVRVLALLVLVTLPWVVLITLASWQNAGLREQNATEPVRIERAVLLRSGAAGLDAGTLAWTFSANGPPRALTGFATAAQLPADPALMRRLPAQGRRAMSVAGTPMVYVVASTPAGMQVLLAIPATVGTAGAATVLGRQVTEAALIMLLSVAAVVYGADRLLAEPVRRLGGAVEGWRAGGMFPGVPEALASGEVRALWTSFTRATAALARRETELLAASRRQDLLMQEIHHRVKNNLQIVASLLNLQASRIRVPAAQAEFQAARDRIRALATLHRHLYAYGELHTINMRGFLMELCEQLLAALGETPAGGRITLQIDAPELQISSDQAVPTALIVTEAVSNAAKYAFPGGRSGHITVRLVVDVGGAGSASIAHLRIEDDGVGIPAGRAMTDAGMRDGIGLTLIRGFARQLGSSVEVSHEGGGTRYDLAIPLTRERADVAMVDLT